MLSHVEDVTATHQTKATYMTREVTVVVEATGVAMPGVALYQSQ